MLLASFPDQIVTEGRGAGVHLRRGRMCVCADCLLGHAVISHWWPWVSPLLWLPFDNLSLWQATVEPGHRWKRNTSIYHPATSGGFQIWLCTEIDTLSAPQQRAGLLIAWKLMAESYFLHVCPLRPPCQPVFTVIWSQNLLVPLWRLSVKCLVLKFWVSWRLGASQSSSFSPSLLHNSAIPHWSNHTLSLVLFSQIFKLHQNNNTNNNNNC